MSGSVGASTYTRNGLVRRRTNPTNTVSTRRSEVRGNLSSFAAQYRTLTDSERAAWTGLITRTNSLGALIVLSPIAAFIAVNTALAACGEPIVTLPPGFGLVTLISNTLLTANGDDAPEAQGLNLSTTNASGAARKIIIEATPVLSAGITNFLTSLRFIACVSVADGDVISDLILPYQAVYGTAMLATSSIGARVGVRVRDLNGGNPLPVGTMSVIVSAA